MDIKKLIRPNILALSPYSTARDENDSGSTIDIFLDANENPYDNQINRYPDPYQLQLKEVISEIKGVSVDKIFLGNGSDEAIDLLFRIFCEPRLDKVDTIKPSYGMYIVASSINDVECTEIPLNENFDISVNQILTSVDRYTKMIILCSPNNPTGNLLSKSEICRLLDSFNGIVVIDEAYIDFSNDPGFIPFLENYKNLVVLQTLSKAWGMAGLRIGMAFASTEIIEYMSRVKYPYNINILAQKAALEELTKNREGLLLQKEEIIRERERLIKSFGSLSYIKHIYKTDSNFILIKCSDATGLYHYLLEKNGVIVRDRSKLFGAENCLRITVGTPSENTALIKYLENYQ